jgi:hypothetical protein
MQGYQPQFEVFAETCLYVSEILAVLCGSELDVSSSILVLVFGESLSSLDAPLYVSPASPP